MVVLAAQGGGDELQQQEQTKLKNTLSGEKHTQSYKEHRDYVDTVSASLHSTRHTVQGERVPQHWQRSGCSGCGIA